MLGYPKELEFEHYYAKYEREDLAGRIVDFPAEETWRDGANIVDGAEDGADDTEFVTAIKKFADRVDLYANAERADKMTGIGRYGILLIGISGGDSMITPVERLNSIDDVLYLRPYSEHSVKIKSLVGNMSDVRYGLPEFYEITSTASDGGEGTAQHVVHWSRVIHIAEGLLENDIYGRPRLRRIYNKLEDLTKVIGGSAEATWKMMRKGFVFDVDPDARLSAADSADIEEQIDEYDHGLRRYLKTRGMKVQDLGSEVVDPTGIADLIFSLISATTGIPKRILLGSERGELASSQDGKNWAGRITNRRSNWAEPVVVRNLIDRLLLWGVLPKPTTGHYTVKWYPLFESEPSEDMEIARGYAEVIATMTQPGIDQVVDVATFLRTFITDLPTDAVINEPALLSDEQNEREQDNQDAFSPQR